MDREEHKKQVRQDNKRRFGMLVVGVVVAAMLGLVCYYTMEGQAKEPNLVAVAVKGYLSVEQQQALTERLQEYTAKSGRAGGIALQVFEFPVDGAENPQTFELLSELAGCISTGKTDLVLIEWYVYDLIKGAGLFEDLSKRYPDDPAVTDGYLYRMEDTGFMQGGQMQDMPDLYLALRSSRSENMNKNSKAMEKYSYMQELLDQIVRGG